MRLALFLSCIALAKCGSQTSLRRAQVDDEMPFRLDEAARKMQFIPNSGASHLRAYTGTEKGGGIDAVRQQKAPKKGGKGGGANNHSKKNHGTKKAKKQKCEFPSASKNNGIIVTQKISFNAFPSVSLPGQRKRKGSTRS